jgi:hypothetical protein
MDGRWLELEWWKADTQSDSCAIGTSNFFPDDSISHSFPGDF